MKRRYRFECEPLTTLMGRVVLKWGGGLISDKSNLCTPHLDRIQALAGCIQNIVHMGYDVIVVHGAGSFGHIRAKEFRLAEGDIDDLDQIDAIKQVRNDMDTLHDLVIASLKPLPVSSHPPRDFVTNTGADFEGNLERFTSSGVHVTFGDVVDCDIPEKFGILSGDDLMLRLSVELPDVEFSIFAMGETPGLMTSDGVEGVLIPEWNGKTQFSGSHSQDIDVTGGIFLKAERAAEIAKVVEHVWFVDGSIPGRIIEIIDSGHTIGTRIVD